MTARHDKATEGRTEAAAVDQAIADVRDLLPPRMDVPSDMPPYMRRDQERTNRAHDILDRFADADYSPAYQDEYQRLWHEAAARAEAAEAELRELRSDIDRERQNYRRENVRLARQVADLEAALRKYGRHGTFCADSTGGKCDCGLDAALAAARSRDPQEGA